MNLKNMIETLQIVSKYVDDPTKEWCQAEHDEIFLPLMNDAEISTEDTQRLEELGAFKSDVDCWKFRT